MPCKTKTLDEIVFPSVFPGGVNKPWKETTPPILEPVLARSRTHKPPKQNPIAPDLDSSIPTFSIAD